MSRKLKDEAPLASSRRLAQRELLENAVPLVVHGYLDLDEAVELLKRGVAAGFERLGGGKALHAYHLSRSDRWIHRHLTAALGPARHTVKHFEQCSIRALAEDSLGAGYRFMLRILACFLKDALSGLSLLEVRARTGLEDWQVSDATLQERIDLYTRMGLLFSEQADGERRWRASVRLLAAPAIGRSTETGLGPWLFPFKLADRSHARSFTHVRIHLTSEGLRKLRERMALALQEGVAEALLEPPQEGGDQREVDVVLAVGTNSVGDSDD